MHAQPNPTQPSIEDATYDALVLDLLLIEHDGLWSIAELQQMLGNKLAVEDALARLHGLGLIHRIENLVCVTRAAAHVRALAS